MGTEEIWLDRERLEESLRAVAEEAREWARRLEHPGMRPGHKKCRAAFEHLAERIEALLRAGEQR